MYEALSNTGLDRMFTRVSLTLAAHCRRHDHRCSSVCRPAFQHWSRLRQEMARRGLPWLSGLEEIIGGTV